MGSNHGLDNDELPDIIKNLMEVNKKESIEEIRQQIFPDRATPGAIGRFPMGKLTPEDEGEIRFVIKADPKTKTVIFDFGKPIAWFAAPAEDARKIAESILERLKEL